MKAIKRSGGYYVVPGTDGRSWVERNSDFEAEHDGREPDSDQEDCEPREE